MNSIPPSSDERLFLVSQADIDKIDALTSALNLAITEILENRPIRDHRANNTRSQTAYDEQVSEILYRLPTEVSKY